MANRTFLENISWNILVTWPDHRSQNLWKKCGSTFGVLQTSQMHSFTHSIMPWTLCKFPSLPLVLEVNFCSTVDFKQHRRFSSLNSGPLSGQMTSEWTKSLNYE